MCCRWRSKCLHSIGECALLRAQRKCCKMDIGLFPMCTFSSVRPVLSLLSINSFCLEFCLKNIQGHNWGLMWWICSYRPDSSHVCCRCCLMCCCKWPCSRLPDILLWLAQSHSGLALQARLPSFPAGYCRGPGSRGRRCFGQLELFPADHSRLLWYCGVLGYIRSWVLVVCLGIRTDDHVLRFWRKQILTAARRAINDFCREHG